MFAGLLYNLVKMAVQLSHVHVSHSFTQSLLSHQHYRFTCIINITLLSTKQLLIFVKHFLYGE